MKSANVTQEDINAAADEIWSKGIRPTQAKVRALLGRGSYSTIHKGLKIWQETNRDTEQTTPNDLVEMPKELWELLIKVWTKAVIVAEDRERSECFSVLEKENEKLRDELMKYEKLEAEFNAIKGLQEKLIDSISKMGQEKEKQENRIKELEAKIMAK